MKIMSQLLLICFSICLLIKYSQQQDYFFCGFDGTNPLNTNVCGGVLLIPSVLSPISSAPLLDVFNGVTITDVTSILSPTLNNGKCNIPYEYNNTMNYFCSKPAAANRFICEINEPGSGEFDDCNIMNGVTIVSKYLKVKQTAGNAYTASIEFRSAIDIPEPGKYRFSLYSYYNIPKDAGEHMAIYIKNGNDGTFTEVYKNGTDFDRFQDIQWIYEDFEIEFTDTPIFIKIEFSRLNKDVIGIIAIDNLRIYEKNMQQTTTTKEKTTSTNKLSTSSTEETSSTTTEVSKTSTHARSTTTKKETTTTTIKEQSTIHTEYFFCDFDGTNTLTTNICGGVTVTPTLSSPVSLSSTTYLDIFNGVTITDVTSILSPTLALEKKCNIPFQYNNTWNYFCTKPTSSNTRFICEIKEPGSREFDDCKIMSGGAFTSKYFKVKESTGFVYNSSIELKNAIILPERGKYRFSLYSYYNIPKDAGEHMVIYIKNGNDGTFTEVYRNGSDFDRLHDIQWMYEDFEIECTDTQLFIKIEFSRLNKDVIGMIAIDNLRVYRRVAIQTVESKTTTEEQKTITTTDKSTNKVTEKLTTSTSEVHQKEYFSCNFDGTNTIASICGGAILTPTLLPPIGLSSTALDVFNGVTITDVTSILSPTLNNGKCNIPYEYNNTMNYFCSKPAAVNRFICEINKPGSGEFDECNIMNGVTIVSKYLKVKQTAGNAYTASIEFRSAIDIPEPGKYRFSLYSYYNIPKDAGEHMVIYIKNGNDGTFTEVYRNGSDFDRFQDTQWIYEDFEIECTDVQIFIRIEFSRLNKDVIGMIAIDNLRLYSIDTETTNIGQKVKNSEEPISKPITFTTFLPHGSKTSESANMPTKVSVDAIELSMTRKAETIRNISEISENSRLSVILIVAIVGGSVVGIVAIIGSCGLSFIKNTRKRENVKVSPRSDDEEVADESV